MEGQLACGSESTVVVHYTADEARSQQKVSAFYEDHVGALPVPRRLQLRIPPTHPLQLPPPHSSFPLVPGKLCCDHLRQHLRNYLPRCGWVLLFLEAPGRRSAMDAAFGGSHKVYSAGGGCEVYDDGSFFSWCNVRARSRTSAGTGIEYDVYLREA